ncbi:MAG: Zn-ribbon containing protein [Nanoarchaeota archaeon]
MAHQCVRCKTFYEDGSSQILKGCDNCGGRFFFYVKKESIKKAEEITTNLSREEVDEMEKDVIDIIGDKFEEDKPIVLNLENIRVLKPGKFEIDLVDLFQGKPLVYKLEDGKYYIDVPSTFAAKELEFKEKSESLPAEEKKVEKKEKNPLD